MPKNHRYAELPDDELVPSRPLPDVPISVQVAHMRELRAAQNGIAARYRQRDALMQAWALSNTLSRADMAAATGLAKSRVDQLIREATEQDIERRNAAAAERVTRHSVA
jgi:hypothetical protein